MSNTKKATVISVIASLMILLSLLAVPAYADYNYGSVFRDNINSKTIAGFDLGTHNYVGNDIGANYIYVTSPEGTSIGYSLSLYKGNGWGYWKFGPSFGARTSGLGGSCWWTSVSDAGGTSSARIRIDRDDPNDKTSLGGYVESQGRTWR